MCLALEASRDKTRRTKEEVGRQGGQRKRWEDKADKGRGGKTRRTKEEVIRQGGQRKRWEDKADKGRGGKTTSGNGQAWSSASPRGQ